MKRVKSMLLLLLAVSMSVTVNAQNISGRITCGTAGVAGVAVSDGIVVTTTDQNGYYSFNSEKMNGYVFFTIPSGYEPEVEDGFKPKFWELLQSSNVSVAETHDFRLKKVNNDKFRMLIGADPHLAGVQNDLSQFHKLFMPRLHDEIKDAGDIPIYSTMLGDLAWDGYWYSQKFDHRAFMETFKQEKYPIMFFPVIGNHDNDGAIPAGDNTDFLSSWSFRKYMAPNYYSYNLGKIHFVVMDDIYYTNTPEDGVTYPVSSGIMGSRDYSGRFTDYQLEWLKKDVALVDPETPIIVCVHIPVWNLNKSNVTTTNLSNTNTMAGILKNFKKVHIVSGHTHYNYHAHPTAYPNMHENNIAAICAIWWWTGKITGVHNCSDGTPGGYELFEFDGTDIKWQYHSMEDKSNPQFRAIDMNSVIEFYKTDPTIKEILADGNLPNARVNFNSTAWVNTVLINVFNYDTDWKISVREGNTPLTVSQVWTEDPYHTLAYDVPYYALYKTYGKESQTRTWNRHSFLVRATTATRPITITVTDPFGNVYTETVERPRPYALHLDRKGNDKLVDLYWNECGMVNAGSYESPQMGQHGTASTVFDSIQDRHLGVVDNGTNSYYFFEYNKDSELGEAFQNAVTWELLFRMDKNEGYNPVYTDDTYTSDASADLKHIIGGEADGGWSLAETTLGGLTFNYTTSSAADAAVNSNINSAAKMTTGNFYHVVVSLDKSNNTMSMFVNGQKVASGATDANAFRFPNIGLTRRDNRMWFTLGGSPREESYPTRATNSTGATYVFAHIYGKALTDDEASALYCDSIKYYTEPTMPSPRDMIMDVHFAGDGAIDKSDFGKITEIGIMNTSYNEDLKRWEATFSGDDRQFVKREISYEPAITSQMGKAVSFEVYCKPYSAIPTTTISPLSFQQTGGLGVELNTSGEVKWNCNTYGNGTSGAAKLTHSPAPSGYHHYVFVYDRVNGSSKIYIDGAVKQSVTISPFQNLTFPLGYCQWIAVGGDPNGLHSPSCDFPWRGQISFARVWGHALDAGEAATLSKQAQNPTTTLSIPATGYVGACLPYVSVVPQGTKAYAASSITGDVVNLTLLANEGELIDYAVPFILCGEKGSYTMEVADKDAIGNQPEVNVLVGNLGKKACQRGEIYQLATVKNEAVMRPITSTSLPMNKVYILNPEGKTDNLHFKIDGGSGISNVKLSDNGGKPVYFDMEGRRVYHPTRGIYIKNGQKVFIK